MLFQRGLYPPESFKAEPQYGMTLFISEDPQIKTFLNNLLSQSEGKPMKIILKAIQKYFHQKLMNVSILMSRPWVGI